VLVQGTAEYFADLFWLELRGNPAAYGNYDAAGHYFFNGTPTAYRLTNYPFHDQPFFAQVLLEYAIEKPEAYFVTLSFAAMIGMSRTAFGNGPGSNDMGVVDWSMANPNSNINGYGRTDADRAYVGKLAWGVQIIDRLWSTVTLRYRDGRPFAQMAINEQGGQAAFSYQTIRGETIAGKKGGPREDYLLNVNYELSYDFAIFCRAGARVALIVTNLFDLGHELSENVYANGTRQPLELEIPRNILLRLELPIEYANATTACAPLSTAILTMGERAGPGLRTKFHTSSAAPMAMTPPPAPKSKFARLTSASAFGWRTLTARNNVVFFLSSASL